MSELMFLLSTPFLGQTVLSESSYGSILDINYPPSPPGLLLNTAHVVKDLFQCSSLIASKLVLLRFER